MAHHDEPGQDRDAGGSTPAIERAVRALRDRLRAELDAPAIAAELVAAARAGLDPTFVVLLTEGLVVGDGAGEWAPAVDDPLMGHALRHPEPVAIDRAAIASKALEPLRERGAAAVAPLVSLGVAVGVLVLGPHRGQTDYSAGELAFLAEICAIGAAALRVATLTDWRAAAERARASNAEELRLAQTIQRSLLPGETPPLPGWRIETHYRPARVIGGDLYDFIPLPGDLLGILLGDASDKSVPAALMMAAARTLLRAAGQRVVLPGLVLERVNDSLCGELPAGMFVTCLFGVLDPATGRLRYANSGHCPPKLRTAEGVTELRARGWPLGMMPGVTYEEHEVVVPPGGTVVLYSDGLIETHDPDGAMFGDRRLVDALAAAGGPIMETVLDAHCRFAGPEWDQEDDLTIVTVERCAPVLDASPLQGVLLELDLPSEEGVEREAAERVVAALGQLPLSARRRDRLRTAVAEAIMNAAEHGNRFRADLRVAVRVTAQAGGVTVAVADQGRGGDIPEPIEPDLAAKLAGLQSPRGWGLFLIERLVDEMRTESTGTGHVMELTMRFDDPGGGAGG